jgi:tartrate/fumarate subfamily iron-sulfur-dependent hydro-lyase beta chain
MISGRVFTGRDALHKHLREGGDCPVNLRDAAIYHCGPVTLHHDGAWHAVAAGPTTSARMDPYTPWLIEHHRVRMVIGKGGMSKAVADACARYGCVYLQTVGGAASLLAACIQEVKDVHFLREFGTADALWEFEVRDFPAVVAIDARGRSLHRRVRNASRRALRGLLAED